MAPPLKVRLITNTHTNRIKSGVIIHTPVILALLVVGGFKASFRLHSDFKFFGAQMNKYK